MRRAIREATSGEFWGTDFDTFPAAVFAEFVVDFGWSSEAAAVTAIRAAKTIVCQVRTKNLMGDILTSLESASPAPNPFRPCRLYRNPHNQNFR